MSNFSDNFDQGFQQFFLGEELSSTLSLDRMDKTGQVKHSKDFATRLVTSPTCSQDTIIIYQKNNQEERFSIFQAIPKFIYSSKDNSDEASDGLRLQESRPLGTMLHDISSEHSNQTFADTRDDVEGGSQVNLVTEVRDYDMAFEQLTTPALDASSTEEIEIVFGGEVDDSSYRDLKGSLWGNIELWETKWGYCNVPVAV